MKVLNCIVLLVVMVMVGSVQAAPITVNGDFEAGAGAFIADNWDEGSGAGSFGGDPIYYAAGEGPYVGGRAASLMANDGAYIQQTLAGVQASHISTYGVTFDAAFRSDFFQGAVDLRVSIIDVTNDVELASQTLTIEDLVDPGGTIDIPFTNYILALAVNTTGLGSEEVGVRFTNLNVSAQAWTETVLVDNVSVVPEPATMLLLSVGGLVAMRRRK